LRTRKAKANSGHDVLYCRNHAQTQVGDHVLVELSGGRIVEATVKAIVDRTDSVRLHVSFGDETALIYLWQIVKEAR
jgi:hypothetical protein